MAVDIKLLTLEPPTETSITTASSSVFNTIPMDGTAPDIWDLYIVGANKTAIIKSMRFINTHTNEVELTLYFMRPDVSNNYQRVLLTPAPMVLPPGFTYVDTTELTMEANDRIQGKANADKKIQYLISGAEREVV